MLTTASIRSMVAAALSLIVPAAALAAWPGDSTTNLPVCVANYRQESPAIATDGLGGAFITWDDWRADPLQARVYVQHIMANGGIASGWPANGAQACTTTANQNEPAIVGDGFGGAILSWNGDTSIGPLGRTRPHAQRVEAGGNPVWGVGGVLLTQVGTGDNKPPAMLSDGAGGAFVAWVDFRSGFNYDIYAQHVAADGSLLWGADGLPIAVTPETQNLPRLASDGTGGVFVAWGDGRSGVGNIYAQRVSSAGSLEWTANGIPVCTIPHTIVVGELASDGAGGAFVSWLDFRSNPAGEAYAHHLTSAGVDPSWTPNGMPLVTVPSAYQTPPLIVADGDSGAIFVWRDYRGGWRPYAQRLDRHATPQWGAGGVQVTQEDWFPEAAVSDSAGGAIIAFAQPFGVADDVRAQRISGSGASLWGPDGVAVSTAPHNQNFRTAV